MSPGTPSACWNSTALHDESIETPSKASNLARRSVSIFSRRGTETPEPKPRFIAQPAMQVPKQVPEKQRRWSKRKSAPVDVSPRFKGTILNAVPPARTIQMTPLEEEMATSPNEEILSAISGTPTTPAMFVWPEPTAQQIDELWKRSSVPLAQRTQSQRRKETVSRIGVWRNGVAHWDENVDKVSSGCEVPSVQEATGFTPLRRTSPVAHTSKPILSVVIPTSEPLINDTTLTTIFRPIPTRPIVPLAPLSVISELDNTKSVAISDEAQQIVSPESPTSRQFRPPLERPKACDYGNPDGTLLSRNEERKQSHSSASSSTGEQDDASMYSQGSSSTSMEVIIGKSRTERRKRQTPSCSPADTPIESPIAERPSPGHPNLNKPLPTSPIPAPTRPAPAPPWFSSENRRIRHASIKSAPDSEQTEVFWNTKHKRQAQSIDQLDLIDQEFMRNAPDALYVPSPSTPTLSQAETELEARLSMFSEQNGIYMINGSEDRDPSVVEVTDDVRVATIDKDFSISKSGSVHRSGSVHSVMHPPERAPTIPRRSRKREWKVPRASLRVTHLSVKSTKRRRSEPQLTLMANEQRACPTLQRRSSATEISLVSDVVELLRTPIEALLPPTPKIVVDDGLPLPNETGSIEDDVHAGPSISAAAAENVLLHILASLDSLTDLFNAAHINKGMHRVYEENEMDLIHTVCSNQSPPAFEFREWSRSNEDATRESSASTTSLEHTPQSYMHAYRGDKTVIESLKKLILERCQTVIRPVTTLALSGASHPHAQRFNDAFWRIWCFCKIFGSGKSREEDVTGQLDWLKGGLLANNQDLTATMNTNLEYDMSSVLLNPPEYFAKGNAGGLSAQQLYDMTEIWTCMKTLLEGYHLRTEQAWNNGVYDECGIGPGDSETEEQLLEEWTSYLLTLGPKVVLEMAEFANDPSSAGFALAKVNGWAQWSPPEYNGSRDTFLKEPVSRLYEERVAATAEMCRNPRDQEKKEMSRKRVATLAAEIKLARQASTFKRLPYINMDTERAMSPSLSRCNSTMSTTSVRSQESVISPLCQSHIIAKRKPVPIRSKRSPNFSVPRPQSPPATLWSPRKISPIIEDKVETFNRMSLQRTGNEVTEESVERAVLCIVDMGFSGSQARQALRMTDVGNGLRMDRAVDLLLRQAA